jgi:hypothetical protein
VWARLRVVPFDVVFPEAQQDKHLDEQLRLDADAVPETFGKWLVTRMGGWMAGLETDLVLEEVACPDPVAPCEPFHARLIYGAATAGFGDDSQT